MTIPFAASEGEGGPRCHGLAEMRIAGPPQSLRDSSPVGELFSIATFALGTARLVQVSGESGSTSVVAAIQ